MLGKIFDTTGQRERAVNEYRQAIQTEIQRRAHWTKPASIWKSLTSVSGVRTETDKALNHATRAGARC